MFEFTKKQFPAVVAMLLILFIGGRYLFSDSMTVYPSYIHAWTQTDRVALAQNFQENNFDFFHPATYNLLTKDGITQVDFPIHDYLVACISSFLKVDLISTFHWYTLLYSLIGIYFLFQTLLLHTRSAVRSVFGATFIFTLPFLVFYENGFLPSAPSFSNFLIGIYFLSLAGLSRTKKPFLLACVFLSLAALARAPFFIFLFALLLQQLWQMWKQKQINWFRVASIGSGIVVFIAYFLYNKHLASVYGSMFLSEPLYFKSFSNFVTIVATAVDRWGDQLMSPYHAILLIGLLVSLGYQVYKSGLQSKAFTSLLHYFLIASAGVLLFFFAFGQQFADHDYYYIDSFLPLVSLLIIIGLTKININKNWYTPVATICGIFFFYFFSYAGQVQKKRYTPTFDDRTHYTYTVYKNAKGDLAKWGVKKEDTLYVLEAASTNMPFTVFGNKGYTNLNSGEEVLAPELNRNFDYALLVDSFFRQSTFGDYPEIIKRLKRVNGNGAITLYEKSDADNPSLFFQNLIYYGYSDFDGKNQLKESATNGLLKKEFGEGYGQSIFIEGKDEFALTVKEPLNDYAADKPIHVLFRGDFYQKDSSRFHLVCAHANYYQTAYTISEINSIGSWQRKLIHYSIAPKYFEKGKELGFYFWNPDQSEIAVDNIELLMYQ